MDSSDFEDMNDPLVDKGGTKMLLSPKSYKREQERKRKAKYRASLSTAKKSKVKEAKNAKQAKARAAMTQVQRKQVKENDSARRAQARSALTEERRNQIRLSDRALRAQAREALAEDRRAEIREEDRLRHILNRNLEHTKVTLKDGLRSIEILHGSFDVPRLADSADALGRIRLVTT